MQNLVKFLSILQLTREQPQYGYFLLGIKHGETSNLAEHHYLVAMVGWMLAEYINEEEPLVDTKTIIGMCLVHDIGELFGGDISGSLSRRYPQMKKFARELERINLGLITSFLTPLQRERVCKLHEAFESREGDESVVAQIADKIETHLFLEHRAIEVVHEKNFFYQNHIRNFVRLVKDKRVQSRLEEFFRAFESVVQNQGFKAGDWIREAAQTTGE